jgi:hypothetical protein
MYNNVRLVKYGLWLTNVAFFYYLKLLVKVFNLYTLFEDWWKIDLDEERTARVDELLGKNFY